MDAHAGVMVIADSDSEGEHLASNDPDCHGDDTAIQKDKSAHQAHSVCFGQSPNKGGAGEGKRAHNTRKRAGSLARPSRGAQAKKRKSIDEDDDDDDDDDHDDEGEEEEDDDDDDYEEEEDNNNDDDDDDYYDFDDDGWVRLKKKEVYKDWIKSFDEHVGYLGDHKDLTNAKPSDFLSLFLTDDFWNLLTNETNRYAQQYLNSQTLKPKSRFHDWYDVTVSEMKAFMSLHLCMGLVEKAEIEDYWAEFWPSYTPGFGKVMSRNRFEIILSFLHFANNGKYVKMGQPGHDRLFKIRPIIDLIIPRFSDVYGPHKELSLDEMTIAFKGRSALKQYNPRKPKKYGFKAFVLSEARSGYVLGWSLYNGDEVDDDLGASHHVVRRLMAPYLGKGHEVYMDSYYTTPAIANELAEKDTGLCGTVSCSRQGMPRHLTKSVLRKGDAPLFMRNGKLLACAWHGTKRVTLLSSIHGNSCVKKPVRSKNPKTAFHELNKPVCVEKYNKFMGEVESADQRIKTNLFPHRSRKWYNRIFNAILSISIANAHIIYRTSTRGPHKPLKIFIHDIITHLFEGYSKKEGKKPGRPSKQSGEIPQRLTERHWLHDANDRPDCAVCSDRSRPKGRHQTKYRCSQCGVGLCAVPCNERYHTLKDYRECHLDRIIKVTI